MSLATPFLVDFILRGAGSPFCQGSFIKSYVILTAAQCLLKHDLATVRLSLHNGSSYDLGPRDVPMIHESFSAHPFRNDIGLLFLGQRSLIPPQPTVEMVGGRSVAPTLTTVEGWGILQYGVPNDLLAMPRTHPRWNRKQVNIMDEMRCLQDGRTSRFTCIGQPGGPLLCGNDATNPKLCGLNMFKYGSSVGRTNPAAYTEMAFYAPWVESKLWCAGFFWRSLRGGCTATTLPKIDLDTGVVTSPGVESSMLLFRFYKFIKTTLSPTVGSVVRASFDVNYMSGAPDGVQVSHILAINGHFPGPTIHALPGDIVEVTVRNRIWNAQGTSIHWHGIPQAGTPFEDGPAHISQCPIPAGEEYVYRFPVRHPGTFWYHSHVGSQYTEGLWGLLLVHNAIDLHPSDTEFYITLKEWYHRNGTENEEWHLSPESRGAPPYPDSGLMNGVGGFTCRLTNRTCDPAEQLHPIFNLKRGEVTKVVVANVGGYSTYDFKVEGHMLTIIEIDGMDTSSPESKEAVFLGAGQRISAILIPLANDTSKSEYWIQAKLRRDVMYLPPESRNINPFPTGLITDVVGRIRYVADDDEDHEALLSTRRTTTISSDKTFTEVLPIFKPFKRPEEKEPVLRPVCAGCRPPVLTYNWKALQDVPPPGGRADTEFVLNLDFVDGADGVRRACFNKRPFMMPSEEEGNGGRSLLMRMLDRNVSSLPSASTPFMAVKYGAVVDIVLNNLRRGPHPVHMHGHHFWVTAVGEPGEGEYNRTKSDNHRPNVRRDTVMVQDRSYVVIRLVADNPGVWPLHCHIDWHQLSGMRIVIVEAADVARTLFNVPDVHDQLCKVNHADN